MPYEVTATRKRPQDFESLIGQEFVVSTLENAIKEGKIAHAYLFSGPRGVGKTSSARLLAKALNCETGPTAHPCGKCESCVNITKGSSVDVIEIDGASNNGVDAVRAIKEEVAFPPQSSRYKIYIIDEVHMLSISAFNALLKTIEEPPEYVIFIFATTEIQKVPQTIRSRCQQFHFQLISQENIVKCLKSAAEDLNIEADENALYWIAKEAAGSMRDSYTLFDQVAAFSEGHITLEKIREKLGLASTDAISTILRHCYLGESGEAISALENLFMQGATENQIVKDFSSYIRTLLFYKEGIRRRELLGFDESDLPEDLVGLFSKDMLETMLRAFLDLYRDMRYSLSPRFELELLISRLSSIRFLSTPLSVAQKLEEITNAVKSGKFEIERKSVSIPLSIPYATISPESKREEGKKLPEEKTEVPEREIASPIPEKKEEKREKTVKGDLIKEIANALRSNSLNLEARYIETGVKSFTLDGDVLTLIMSSKMAKDMILKSRSEEERLISRVLGRNIHLSLEEYKEEEKKYSAEVEYLRSVFKNTEPYEIKEETIRHEHKPVRNDEAAGEFREQDEGDEGGDF